MYVFYVEFYFPRVKSIAGCFRTDTESAPLLKTTGTVLTWNGSTKLTAVTISVPNHPKPESISLYQQLTSRIYAQD